MATQAHKPWRHPYQDRLFWNSLKRRTFSSQNEMGPMWIGFNHIQHGYISYIIMVNSIFARLSHVCQCFGTYAWTLCIFQTQKGSETPNINTSEPLQVRSSHFGPSQPGVSLWLRQCERWSGHKDVVAVLGHDTWFSVCFFKGATSWGDSHHNLGTAYVFCGLWFQWWCVFSKMIMTYYDIVWHTMTDFDRYFARGKWVDKFAGVKLILPCQPLVVTQSAG